MKKGLEKGAMIAVAAAGLMLAGCATHGHGSSCGMSSRAGAVKHMCKGKAACKGKAGCKGHHATSTAIHTQQEKV